MAIIKTPTQARSEIYKLIDTTNRDSQPILIAGKNINKSAVLMSQKDYDAQQETMALLLNGQISDAIKRDKEPDKDEVDAFQMLKDLDNE